MELTASTGYSGFIGSQWWVGPPRQVSEASGDVGATPPTFWAAPLQCTPCFADWSAYDSVHVYDRAIVPSAAYAVQFIAEGCQESEDRFSAALSIVTSKWGDAVDVTTGVGSPDSFADFSDISAVVDKFKNLPGAIAKSRADMAGDVATTGGVPDQIIDFVDIPYAVEAFRSIAYPFGGPTPCSPSVNR